MAERPRGAFRADWWAICGRCSNTKYMDTGEYGTPRKAAEAAGWLYTKRHGWVCPFCQLADTLDDSEH